MTSDFLTRGQAAAAKSAHGFVRPAGSIEAIWVHLTPFAPDCADLDMADDGRWRCLAWRTPGQALVAILRRLALLPDQVVLTADPSQPAKSVCDIHDRQGRLLAIVWDVPAAALIAAHDALTEQRRLAA